ncbi:MAG: GNAT family N-acetyltransferase [Clostridia bacterium]|nr:GNAT family N-acetyltransferase [Clostridia bacterium]
MNKPDKSNNIRLFKESDVTKYLPRLVHTDYYSDFYNEVSQNSDEIFTIGCGDKVIGLSCIDDDTEGFIYVYIFPEDRHNGYGYAAAIASLRQMKSSPINCIYTCYDGNDRVAKKLAEKLGYIKKYSSAFMKYRGEKFVEPTLPIRRYKSEDFEQAFTLAAEAFHKMRLETGCFPESVAAGPDDEAKKYWADTANERYVYVLGNEIVGHAKIEGETLDSVAIKISHQGKGLGRKFVIFLVNQIMKNENECPCLWCVVGNNTARSLYESLGFEETGLCEFAVKRFTE